MEGPFEEANGDLCSLSFAQVVVLRTHSKWDSAWFGSWLRSQPLDAIPISMGGRTKDGIARYCFMEEYLHGESVGEQRGDVPVATPHAVVTW